MSAQTLVFQTANNKLKEIEESLSLFTIEETCKEDIKQTIKLLENLLEEVKEIDQLINPPHI